MKKRLSIIVCFAAFVSITFAQDLSKEEKKRLREEIKNYSNDLAGYKAKMDDIRNTLDSNEAEIKRLKDDIAYASTKQAELENKVADFDTQLTVCHEENNVLKGYTGTAAATGPVDTALTQKVLSGLNNAPQKGTVYKVQIGLYKQFNINKYFEQPRYIGYEEVDGMNRYIISYFPDEEVAKNFVADVRKMGIKDAFVSKYIDGERVYEWSKNPKYQGKPEPASLQEALENDKKGKKK
jgi:hypothetical protein